MSKVAEKDPRFGVDEKLLAKPVRHMVLEDIGEWKEEPKPNVKKALDEYFHRYCSPVSETKIENGEEKVQEFCPACGKPFTGLLANLGLGVGIEWGLAHGEGYCSHCRWPYRGHHKIWDQSDLDENGRPIDGREPLLTINNLFLAYHPENVDVRWRPPTED
jgi:hypothetical protein